MHRQTSAFFFTALAVVACLTIPYQNVVADSGQRWSYALSWSPEFCGRSLSSKESQCDGDHLLVPQWLSLVESPGSERHCQTSTPLPPDVAEHLDLVTANRQVAQARWQREGACLGDPQKYFTRLDYATRTIAIPIGLGSAPGVRKFSSEEFKSLFVQSNPGLEVSGLSLNCRLSFLESVNVCLDGNLRFAACSTSDSGSCGSTFKLRPNLREPH